MECYYDIEVQLVLNALNCKLANKWRSQIQKSPWFFSVGAGFGYICQK